MKNNIRSFIFVWILLLGGHAAFAQSNQAVDVFNQEICRGVSVRLNGTLYKLKGGYKVTSITADNQPGVELVNEERVTPQQTTVYTIKSATTAGAAQPDAKVTVTVHNRPTLSIEFVNESSAVSEGMVCKGSVLQFQVKASGNLDGNPVYWYVSSLDKPASGNTFSFTAENTCEVTALANNGYCPIADTTIRVRVFTPPTPEDVDVVWNTQWSETLCQSCGFFPDLRDILKSGGDEVDYANSSIEWEEGGTNEKTLAVGTNTYKLRIHYTVRRHNRCGDVTMTYDTVVSLQLANVKDCKVGLTSSYITVRPCETARISLEPGYAGTLQLKGNGAVEPKMEDLSASPVAGEWLVTRTGPIQQSGKELYSWEVLLQKYTAPKTWAGFKVSGTARMSCPYSKTEPVKTVNYSMTVPVRLDTSYLTTKFEYCPDQKGTLEVSVPEQIGGVNPAVTLNNLSFPKPAGVSGRLVPLTGLSTAAKSVYETSVAVGGSNVADFLPLTVKAVYKVNVVKGNLNCVFTQTEEKIVQSNPRSDCDISFGLPNTETCIGVAKTLIVSGGSGGNNIEVTDITIDDKGSLAIKVDPFQTMNNGGKLSFYPYYAGAPGVAAKTDTITATATYRMNGSSQELKWTKQFEVKVKACEPKLSAYSFDCSTCLRCPGTEGRITVVFQNPTTDERISRVDWRSEPPTKVTTSWSYPQSVPTYRVSARYYTDTKLEHISVVYNEGDSVYALKLTQLANGSTVPFQDFKVDSACVLRVKPDQDSCCLKDEIEADIINGNSKTVGKNTYYSQFQRLIWDPSIVRYVAESSQNLTTEQNLQSGNKGYRVRVLAYEEGIYPFQVVSQVGDTMITYADTLRLTVLGRPRAFIQDTVYACLGLNLDLGKYVDNTMVKKIGSSVPSDLHHYVPNTEDPQTVYAYQIDMLGKCLSLAPSHRLDKDSLVVIAAPSVYISTINTQEHCPGDVFVLQAPTNGSSVWWKQKKYPTGGYGARELVVSDWPGSKDLQLIMGFDTMLYTIEAHTLCPDNGDASVSFNAYPKPGPEFVIRDTFACGSETVLLKADYDASTAGPVTWKVDGKTVTDPHVQSPYPARDYTMKVEGTVKGTVAGVNDCPSRDTAVIKFYASPTVAIQGKNATGILCVDGDVSTRIQAQGDASNQYTWHLKTGSGAQIGTGSVLNRAFGKDTLVYVVASNGGSCKAFDSARIVLYGKKRTVADTTACIGSDFSFSMPRQQDVEYRWYAPDGTYICPCEDHKFEDFAPQAVGTYKVEIKRKGCIVTQDIDILAYPVPDMDFGTAEDPVRFCAGSPLVLRLRPKVDGKEVSGYFVWTDPTGEEVLSGDGKNTYTKNPVLMVDRGVYTASVTLQDGCTHSASVNVRVDDHTQPDFSLNPYYCEGETVDLVAEYQGDGSTYEWFGASGLHLGPAADLHKTTLSDLTARNEKLFLVVTRGACQDTTSRYLTVRERPTAEVEVHGGTLMDGELFFCEGESVVIALKNLLPGDTTRWTLPNGSTLADVGEWRANSVSKAEGGLYSVVVRRNGCASEVETVDLDVRIVPVLILQDTFFCQGRDIVVNVANADYPGATYMWRELNVQAPEARLDRAGEYHIVMDLRGCADEESFLLSSRPVPEWEFPSDTSICNRDSLVLQGPEGMDSYRWQDGSTQRWFLVRNAGLYTLTVTDSGCANEKSVYVETEFCSPVFFASAFSPNGDGINDTFGPISLAEEDELEYAFFVYNANGQLVFQSTDIRSSWDGTFKGQPCPAGIYTYRCKIVVIESGRDLSRIGTVHLIR